MSSYCYVRVLILLCMCPQTAIYVSSYCYVCVLKLLCMCPHAAMYRVLMLLCTVSSYCYVCVLILLCTVTSYCYVCSSYCYAMYVSSGEAVLYVFPHAAILCMCPHTAMYVSSGEAVRLWTSKAAYTSSLSSLRPHTLVAHAMYVSSGEAVRLRTSKAEANGIRRNHQQLCWHAGRDS